MKIGKLSIAAGLALTAIGFSSPAQAQERTLGEIFMVGFNFCPRGSAATDGQLVAISQNTALFSLLGTTFGGDGRTTFAYPDLRSRSPIHMGRGPGLSDRRWGERLGSETNTLLIQNLAAHNHSAIVDAHANDADKQGAQGNYFGRAAVNVYTRQPSATIAPMAADAIKVSNTGSNVPVNNMQPSLTIRFCIATQGIFPSRS